MSPTEKYTYLRQAGFSHNEALALINNGKLPHADTQLKVVAIQRLSLQAGVAK